MLQHQIQRLRHFIANEPVTLKEVTECVNLAMERATEISLSYDGRLEQMPTQLKGELNMLKELTESAFCAGENLLVLRRNANRCEAAIQSALDVAALGTDRITIH
jgi:hypothetical protein